MVSQEEMKAVRGALPQDKVFAAAALTQELYSRTKETLGGLVAAMTSNIYGDSKNWNPQLVIGNLERYDRTVHDALAGIGELIEADPRLGPEYKEWLLERSKHLVILKNEVRPWYEHIVDRARNRVTSIELAKEEEEGAQAYVARLGELRERFNRVGTTN